MKEFFQQFKSGTPEHCLNTNNTTVIYKSPTSDVPWFYLTKRDPPVGALQSQYLIYNKNGYSLECHIPFTMDVSSPNLYINP